MGNGFYKTQTLLAFGFTL